jgi:hypothetical protein
VVRLLAARFSNSSPAQYSALSERNGLQVFEAIVRLACFVAAFDILRPQLHQRLNNREVVLMLKTYQGSCHCGTVRFEADVNISAGTGKCNCTICSKMRLWSVQAKPEAFRLIAGAAKLTDYRGNNPVAHHLFCRRCGVRPFEWVDMPNMSGASTTISTSPASTASISTNSSAAPVTYYDGLTGHRLSGTFAFESSDQKGLGSRDFISSLLYPEFPLRILIRKVRGDQEIEAAARVAPPCSLVLN